MKHQNLITSIDRSSKIIKSNAKTEYSYHFTEENINAQYDKLNKNINNLGIYIMANSLSNPAIDSANMTESENKQAQMSALDSQTAENGFLQIISTNLSDVDSMRQIYVDNKAEAAETFEVSKSTDDSDEKKSSEMTGFESSDDETVSNGQNTSVEMLNTIIKEDFVSNDQNFSSEMTKNEIRKDFAELGKTPLAKFASLYNFTAKEAVSNNGKTNYKHHKLLKKYPESNETEKLSIKDDITNCGVRTPIHLFNGQLIDGRLRLEYARDLKIPFMVIEWEGDENNLQRLMDALHILKKDYTATQRAFMRLENTDRFKKPKSIADQKAIAKGQQTKSGHDTNEEANRYYKTSAGMVAKVRKFSDLCKKSKLYDYARNGKINIDIAIYLAGIKVVDDTEILDMIVLHELNSSQARDLDGIKKSEDAADLFAKIKSSSDSKQVKRLIKYFPYINYPEIFVELMSESIDVKEAERRRALLQGNSDSTKSNSEASFKIEDSLQSRISSLASGAKMSVNDFLLRILERYENSLLENEL